MNPDFVKRMSAPLPRYTSYPTAPHFRDNVGAVEYAEALARLPAAAQLSLYVHIPFCEQLCWYCGCNTKVVNHRKPIDQYLDRLQAEIQMVAALLQGTRNVCDIHWGGGSPNILAPDQIRQLVGTLRQIYHLSPSLEFAVEIDPRWLTAEQIDAFAQSGVTRASLGVQDFDPAVQKAINREQSFEATKAAIDALRAKGIRSVNIDLVYGLPHQTRESVASTVERVIALAPDRIALFGYAHLPSRAKHQSLIDEKALPGTVERFAQSRRARRVLGQAGYVAIGLDHFARPHDEMATGEVHRNFQGYTTDASDALIGFGSSAVSKLPDGYFQNAPIRPDYEKRVDELGLATARGFVLSQDDKMRGYVIERLMCDFSFSQSELRSRFGDEAAPIIEEAEALVDTESEGLVEKTDDGFRLTPRGEPFVRSIAACFDAYLGQGQATYSSGV